MQTPTEFQNGMQRLILKPGGSIVSDFEGELTPITLESIDSITIEDGKKRVVIRYSGGKKEPYVAQTTDEAAMIARAVAKHMGFRARERVQPTVFDAALVPGTCFLIAASVTVLLTFVAASVRESSRSPVSRRDTALVRLIENLDFLDANFCIGFLVTLTLAGFLCYKICNRRQKTIYTPN